MPNLRITYVDSGDIYEPFIVAALKEKYTITRVVGPSANPDLVVCSVFGKSHQQYNSYLKLCISGENNYPDFQQYDYYVSCHNLQYGSRHLRIPFFAFRGQYEYVLNQDRNIDKLRAELNTKRNEFISRKFCSAVISNAICADPRREQFFNSINNWKKVDSAGKAFNTVGRLDDIVKSIPTNEFGLTNFVKHCFIRNYKFNLAFENSESEGYITEKILDAFAASTIPIYFGSTDVKQIFNPKSFINALDFDSISEMIKYIDILDKDHDTYMDMLMCNKFIDTTNYITQFNEFVNNIVLTRQKFERKYGWMQHM